MCEWRRVVRRKLPPLALHGEREAEIVEEVALQLEQAYQRALDEGASDADARARAESQVLDWQSLADEIVLAERPLAARLPARTVATPDRPQPGDRAFLLGVTRDVRYAWRTMRRQPGFTALVVATIAVAISATTLIFSVVNALLLRPLPFADADRLILATELAPDGSVMSVAYPNFMDWKRRSRAYSNLVAYQPARVALTGVGPAEYLNGRVVSSDFFQMLGATPQLGRLLDRQDDIRGGPRVVVVSDRLWRGRFGADPALVGRTLQLAGESHTVVGVLPPGFELRRYDDVYVPLEPNVGQGMLDRGNHTGIVALGRLAPGVSMDAARRELEGLAAQLATEYPDTNSGNGASLRPLHAVLVQDVRATLLVLMAAVGCVLLIGCVNVAGLLLARAAARQHELVLRVALGASRGRIVRQLLTESVFLATLGGLAGVVLAHQALPLFLAMLPGSTPRLDSVAIDVRVLAFATLLTGLTGVLFGLAPALHASRTNLAHAGGGAQRWTSAVGPRPRLRQALLVGEIAMAIVLLTGAGLMLRTVARLAAVDPGFDADGLVTVQVGLAGRHYNPERHLVTQEALLERVRALPGMQGAALTSSLPLEGAHWDSVFIVEGQPVPPRAQLPSAEFLPISAGYVETLRMRLVRGRTFTDADRGDSPRVAVINEAMARRFWPDEDPVGKRLKQGWPESPTPWREVIGVVGDVRMEGVDVKVGLQVYLPLAHEARGPLYVVARPAVPAAIAIRTIEDVVRQIDGDVPVFGARTMDAVFDESIASRRLSMLLLTMFAGTALLLAGLGIFGVTAWTVVQRTRELGVRMALGASRRHILRMVVGDGLQVAASGVALGLAGAWIATRYLRALLFEVSPTDPLTFGAVVAVLMAVALVSAYLPARRATRLDPLAALRTE